MTCSAAERQRRRRARIRTGVRLVTLELTFDDVDALIEAGMLAAWDDQDPPAIAAAIMRLLSRVTAPDRAAG